MARARQAMLNAAGVYKSRPYFMDQFSKTINVADLNPPTKYVPKRRNGALFLSSQIGRGEGTGRLNKILACAMSSGADRRG